MTYKTTNSGRNFRDSYPAWVSPAIFSVSNQNSKRIFSLVESEITNNFEKLFSQSDSVMILNLSEHARLLALDMRGMMRTTCLW